MDQQPTQSPMPAPEMNAPKQNTLLLIGTYILFFIPYLAGDAKNNPFIKFHMKQSLGLLLCWLATVIIIDRLPYIWTLTWLIELFITVLWFIGVIKAVQGKQEPVPLVGQYFDKISL